MDHQDRPLETILKYAFLITPYASVMAIQYLWGYWGSFNISIFNYISLSDIIKLALIPIVYLVVLSAITAAVMYFVTELKTRREKGKNIVVPPPSRVFILILNIVMFVVGILIIVLMTDARKWLLAGALLGGSFARTIDSLEVFKRLIPNANVRYSIALLISIPLFGAYGLGKRSAQSVLRGEKRITLIETKIFREYGSETFVKKHLLEHDQLKFVGIAGDYLFFITKDTTKVFVVKFSDVHFLEFNPWA